MVKRERDFNFRKKIRWIKFDLEEQRKYQVVVWRLEVVLGVAEFIVPEERKSCRGGLVTIYRQGGQALRSRLYIKT